MSTHKECRSCRKRTRQDSETRPRSAEQMPVRELPWARSSARRRRASDSRDADAIGQATHEFLAPRKLLERHPLVGLMCLRDVTRPANDRRNTGVMEERRLAAEGNLAEFVRARASLTQLGDLAATMRVEAGKRRDVIELDV